MTKRLTNTQWLLSDRDRDCRTQWLLSDSDRDCRNRDCRPQWKESLVISFLIAMTKTPDQKQLKGGRVHSAHSSEGHSPPPQKKLQCSNLFCGANEKAERRVVLLGWLSPFPTFLSSLVWDPSLQYAYIDNQSRSFFWKLLPEMLRGVSPRGF